MDTVALLLRVRFLESESKNGFVISDHMGFSQPKKPEDPKKDHLP